ncbi:MAG TPA: YhjD/YihY/BrkB family envelope integrity protein [Actinomycetota bacterium]
MAGERRQRLEALLASGQASLERARARSLVVDTVVGVVRRERPVAVGILAGSLAFRLFALLIPLAYVLVAGFGFAGARVSARLGSEDRLGAMVVDSIATATRTSDRARWLALIFGGVTTLLAAASVVEVLRWVQVLAWRVRPTRGRRSPWTALGLVAGVAVVATTSTLAEQARADARGLASEVTVLLATAAGQVVVVTCLWLALSWSMRPVAVPWTALVPGACLFAGGTQGFSLAMTVYFAPRAARASTMYGSLGVALTLLVSLFLLARLAVAAEELNAALWERRHPDGRPRRRAT